MADPGNAIAPNDFLDSIGNLSNPIEVNGEISEDHINIHCPWRRSDAAAACDVVVAARHCDNLEARDDMGVWPDKDFTKWQNFANKYAQMLGTRPDASGPSDELLAGEPNQGKLGDKDGSNPG